MGVDRKEQEECRAEAQRAVERRSCATSSRLPRNGTGAGKRSLRVLVVELECVRLGGVGLDLLVAGDVLTALELAATRLHLGVHARRARRRRRGVQLIDLLEAQTARLDDEEVRKHGAAEARGRPDEEDCRRQASALREGQAQHCSLTLGLQVRIALAAVNHVGRGIADGPVEQPVRADLAVSWGHWQLAAR